MKKLLLKSMLLLCALVVGSANAWAAVSTLTFSAKCNGSGTADDDVVWTVSSDATESNFDSNRGIHYGTNSAAVSYIQLSTSGITSGTITQIVVNASGNNSPSLNVTVGGNSFGNTATNLTTSNAAYTFTGSAAAGTIIVRLAKSSSATGALYVKSIAVTYSLPSGTKEDAGLAYPKSKYATTYGSSFTEPTLTNPHSLTVAYVSSNTDVATINSSTGVLTIKATGVTTITASSEATSDYNAGNASYELHVFEHDGTTSAKAFTVSEAKEYIENGFYESNTYYYVRGTVTSTTSTLESYGSLKYYISADGTTSNELYVYNGRDLSNVAFTDGTKLVADENVIIYGKLNYYNNTTPQITYSYLYKRGDVTTPNLTVDDIPNMDTTTEVLTSTLYETNSTGAVTFSSTDETVAKVEGGKLKALKPGTAIITVNVAAVANTFAAISKTFNVTVTSKPAVIPDGTIYSLVTNASELAANDKIIFVSSKADGSAYAMGAQNGNNRSGVAVTVADNTVTLPSSAVQVISLEGSSSAWNFNVGSGYLYATSSSSNNMGTRSPKGDDNANATIAISEDVATITFKGDKTRNVIRYNPNGGSPIFSCYASNSTTGNLPYIYRLNSNPSSFKIEIGSTGYKTIISAHSATLPDGLTAYKAVSVSAGSIQLTPVASIKAGCAYILKGTAGANYTLTVTNSPDDPSDNILEVSTETSGNGCYVLANGSSGVGFYKWTGGSLGAGRAIVPASAVPVSTAREFLSFDFGDDTTGVNEIKTTQKADNQYFNLAGQRVAQPTKGLYIVNGKKVIIK